MNRWGGLLKRARERRGLTQHEVAVLLDRSQPSVNQAEHQSWPTLAQLERYAEALGYRLEVRFVDVLEEGREDIT